MYSPLPNPKIETFQSSYITIFLYIKSTNMESQPIKMKRERFVINPQYG